MIIKNESFQENQSCENCRHSSICKYCSDMSSKKDSISRLIGAPLSPVQIKITCKNFERNNLRQDGVFFR